MINSLGQNKHRGNTLIVVLILLIIITVLGTIAVRQGLFSLKVATNSQAQSLLLQNTDAYFLKLEAASNVQKIINASKFGPIGFASQPENIGSEIAFCFTRASEQSFDTNQVGLFNENKTNSVFTGLNKGYCDPSKVGSFTSGRKAVMTQVSIKVQNQAAAPLENFIEGTDTELVNQPMRVRINVVSLLPAMAPDVTKETVIGCLQKYPADPINGSLTIASCLKTNNVPFNAQVAEYKQSNTPM